MVTFNGMPLTNQEIYDVYYHQASSVRPI